MQAIIPRIERRIVAYGTSNQADLVASHSEVRNFGSRYDVRRHGKLLGEIEQEGLGQFGAVLQIHLS